VATLQYRPAISADAAECIALRGRTRENAISAAELASMGITAGSWENNIEAGRLPGYLCTDGNTIVGYCFGDKHGKALLSQVVEDLRSLGYRRVFLGCSSDSSHRSYGFYRHLGWTPTGSLDANDDEVLELHWQDPAHAA
jgi:hypothetical protein